MIAPRVLKLTNYGGTGGVLEVGSARYPIPYDAKVRKVGALAYVLDKSGDVFLFTSAGQVEIPRALKAALRMKYFSDSSEVSLPG